MPSRCHQFIPENKWFCRHHGDRVSCGPQDEVGVPDQRNQLVFLTGCSHSTFVETCHLLSLVSMSLRQFDNTQRLYIVPEVNHMRTQHTVTIGDSPLIVSGDARCDLPGHCASFGSYTILDSASHLNLAQEAVHVTEVKHSYWFETEGLERCLQHIEAHGCSVETLATDRHPSRDSHADIWHEYDLWHIAKGLRKQLVAIGKPEVLPLARALTHHLRYCAATAGGSVQVQKEKWFTTSQMNTTSELEIVHALYTKYVPKRNEFGQQGMVARLQVAALDHNYSVDRQQATTKEGELRLKQEFSKAARVLVVKPIKEEKTCASCLSFYMASLTAVPM
ncbi:unnamed protein product, partial [Coregonus sp. 'balchen']